MISFCMKKLFSYVLTLFFSSIIISSCVNHEDELLDYDLPGGDEDRPNVSDGTDCDEENGSDDNDPKEEPVLTNIMAFFSEDSKWEVLTYDTYTPQEVLIRYELKGRVQVAGHDCLKYYKIITEPTLKETFMGYVFVEREQVFYLFTETDGDPMLIYDFGLNIDDRITTYEVQDPRYSGYSPLSLQMCVGIGQVTSCGHTFEYLEMCELLSNGSEPDFAHHHGQWIKGLGGLNFMNGIFGNCRYNNDGGSSVLQSVIVNGETVYSCDDVSYIINQ